MFSLKNGGMGLGSVSPKIPKAYVTKTTAIAKQIASGKIKVKAHGQVLDKSVHGGGLRPPP